MNHRNGSTFVGNVSFDVDADDLVAFASKFGAVVRATVLRRPDGRSKGCGFVLWSTEEDAARAVTSMNGQTLDGCVLRVEAARPRDAERGMRKRVA
jgi:RNA recognition motif-containing protein